MRLLLVTENFPPVPCGIGDQTFRLAEALARRGHLVHVYTSKVKKSSDQPERPIPGVSLHREGEVWDRRELDRLAALAADLDIDVIHLQYHAFSYRRQPVVCFLPQILKKRARGKPTRTVVTLHELAGPVLAHWPPLFRRFWLLPLCYFSDAVVTSNERDDRLLGLVPWLRRKRALIPPASSIHVQLMEESDRRRLRLRWHIPQEAFLLIRFGFIQNFEISSFPIVLEAVRTVKQRGIPAHLLLVGSEDSMAREQLNALLKKLQLADSVTVTGALSEEEISRCLAASDAAVQLYPEGACERRSALQAALSHGLPVVSTCGPGVPTLFRHGENILLVPPKDVPALAGALEKLYREPLLRKQLASGAAAVAAHFSWDASAEKLEALYTSLP